MTEKEAAEMIRQASRVDLSDCSLDELIEFWDSIIPAEPDLTD
jgi:hypothetical protein